MVDFTHDHWHPCWHSVICKNLSRSFTTFAFLPFFLFWLCFLFSVFLLLWTFPLFRAFFLLAVFLAFLLLWLLTKWVNSDSFSYYWFSTRTQLLKKNRIRICPNMAKPVHAGIMGHKKPVRCSPRNKSFDPKCVSCVLPGRFFYLDGRVSLALWHHLVLHTRPRMSINPSKMRLHLIFTIRICVMGSKEERSTLM